MTNSDKGVSSGFAQKKVSSCAASDVQEHTRAQSTPPIVRNAPTAAMARASLSDCAVASCSSSLDGRINLVARRRNDQQSHSECR